MSNQEPLEGFYTAFAAHDGATITKAVQGRARAGLDAFTKA